MQFSKIIFQTWKSKIDFPGNYKKWSETWKNYHHDWQYILHDDDDNRNFIKENYPWFLEKYDSYTKMIYRVDSVRYFFLYHYGGIYADMDFECLKNFENLLNPNYDVILGKMTDNPDFAKHSIPNALMISKPRQDFWISAFYNLLNKEDKGDDPEFLTGPMFLFETFQNYENFENREYIIKLMEKHNCPMPINEKSKIKLELPKIFYPIDWSNDSYEIKIFRKAIVKGEKEVSHEKVKEMFPDSYAITYWTHIYRKSASQGWTPKNT